MKKWLLHYYVDCSATQRFNFIDVTDMIDWKIESNKLQLNYSDSVKKVGTGDYGILVFAKGGTPNSTVEYDNCAIKVRNPSLADHGLFGYILNNELSKKYN